MQFPSVVIIIVLLCGFHQIVQLHIEHRTAKCLSNGFLAQIGLVCLGTSRSPATLSSAQLVEPSQWFCMIYCVKLTFKSHSFQLSIHAQFSMFENKIVTYLKKRFQIFQSFIYIFFKSTEYRILPITAGSYPNQFFNSLDPYHFTVGHFESKWCKKIYLTHFCKNAKIQRLLTKQS